MRGRRCLPRLDEGVELPPSLFRRLYRRLAWTFQGEVTWFERKMYSSLSHEANKAMNLNSYIGLMGPVFEVQGDPGGTGAGARRTARYRSRSRTPTTC